MNKNTQSTIIPIQSPWGDTLLDALKQTEHTLLIVCPYIKEQVVLNMQQALLPATSQRNNALHVRIITRVDPDDLLNGSSDIVALQHLLAWSNVLPDCTVEMRAIPNVHAKVWVFDTRLAIVGSGNATPSGLDGNLEYGLAVYDPSLVAHILSDWQLWWDQADHVEAQALAEIAEKLQQVRQSQAMHQNQLQRQLIQQEISKIPSLGKRIPFKKAQQPASPLIKEQPEPLSADSSNELDERTDSRQALTTAGFGDLTRTAFVQEALPVLAPDFWHALTWVIPFVEETDGLIDPLNHPDTYLKLFWKAAPHDRQELRLIWADGNRYSQAALPVQSNSQQPSWSVTFNIEQIRMFGKIVQNQDLKKAQFFTKNVEQRFYLRLNMESHSTLSIAYLLNPARRWSGRVVELPCTQAIIPGNFPALRTPISRITVSHQHVYAALLSLNHEWESLHASANPLTIIELSLTTSGTSHTLTLSTGQIDTPITRSVEGTDGSIAGPQISVRLDCASLQQVLNSAQQQVNRWQLCIDRNADAIQCLPEPDILSDSTLLWRHQLRSL